MNQKKIVYVIKESGTDFYRIGSTHSLDYRKKVLRQGNPRELEIYYKEEFDDSEMVKRTERTIQHLFKKYHYNDSWFKVPESSIMEIGIRLKQIRMNYDMEELKRKQKIEYENFWNQEYYNLKYKQHLREVHRTDRTT